MEKEGEREKFSHAEVIICLDVCSNLKKGSHFFYLFFFFRGVCSTNPTQEKKKQKTSRVSERGLFPLRS